MRSQGEDKRCSDHKRESWRRELASRHPAARTDFGSMFWSCFFGALVSGSHTLPQREHHQKLANDFGKMYEENAAARDQGKTDARAQMMGALTNIPLT